MVPIGYTEAVPAKPRLQFSLLTLFALTAVVAFVAAHPNLCALMATLLLLLGTPWVALFASAIWLAKKLTPDDGDKTA
jgi:hypothetical protein